MKKVCFECETTESSEWQQFEVSAQDPISIACSDGPMSYIVKEIDICKDCYDSANGDLGCIDEP